MEAGKKKILHVDDEPDTLAVVKKILETEGYEVIGLGSGKEALRAIDDDGYDLLLLDIMMPDMSGWDLFTRIGKIHPSYRVVFMSVLEVSPERKEELMKAGVKDYITKPFDRGDLVDRVKKILG